MPLLLMGGFFLSKTTTKGTGAFVVVPFVSTCNIWAPI